MYNIIPLILILISLSIIIVIVVRKFSVLANLDVENIQAEKEAIFKEQIISNRLKRNAVKWSAKLIKIARITTEKTSAIFKWFYNKLYDLKDTYSSSMNLPDDDKVAKIREMNLEIEEFLKNEDFEKAEKMLIEIIGLDSQNLKAFENLGGLYYKIKNYEEAKQTYSHILKLIEGNKDLEKEFTKEGNNKIAEVYFNLALINQATENYDEAIEDLKKALNLEPNNPRYLDIRLEISIINKDKVLALDSLDKLKKANPDNKKLAEFKEQIKKL